ncbi:MAG: radical SAM protein [Pseudomonadota bacterium]
MPTIAPEDNTFHTLMVDVTHRCNMHCTNCYLPNRNFPDMDIDRLEGLLAHLPTRAIIRLVGAEPTLRHDLPDMIRRVRRYGHRPIVLTNGLRMARAGYVAELRAAGLRTVYLSMNGADNNDWYENLDNMRCAGKKLRALKNIVAKRMIPSTGTIIARGVNEGAVMRMVDLVNGLRPRHALLRFKTVGALGRFDVNAERENLSLAG